MAKRRYCYDYPRPMVTVDCVLLRVNGESLEVLLIRRKSEPAKGAWALPGGFVNINEPPEAAVLRELKEETGLKDVACLMQIGAYGDPKRDPRGRVISIAYLATLTGANAKIKCGSDAADAHWHPVDLPPMGLAFDHPTIIGDALRRLAVGGRMSGVLFSFLPKQFTLAQMGAVLAAVYGVPMDPKPYLKHFMDNQAVKRSKDGRKFRFMGWQAGR